MINNYIKTAWRSFRGNRIFAFINVFGLAVGLTCCMLISAYLYQELSYDRYPVNANQIYRIGIHLSQNGSIVDFPSVDVGVGQGIKEAFPQVLAATRLTNDHPDYIKYNNKIFKEEKLAQADSNFFSVFSIPLLEGDSKTALSEPNSIVITKNLEHKYFGDEPGLNKLLSATGKLYKVTGVIDEIPDNSHFHADAFISMSTNVTPSVPRTWSNIGYFTYLLLDKNANPKKIEAKLPQLVAKYVVPETQHDMGVSLAEAQKSINTFLFYLQPLTDIHLHSNTKYEFEPNGDIHYVYIFGALALFILILACINFTNLSTAEAGRRAKEIGIRKVLGSEKNKLIFQFLTESLLFTCLAMLLALGLVSLLLPYFNLLAGKQFTMDFFFSYRAIFFGVLLTFFVGFVSGVYPAFFLSSFSIQNILKGGRSAQLNGRSNLRSGLIVFQFAISTALIVATFVVYQQLHFMQTAKLGYSKDQVLVLNETWSLRKSIGAFKQQFLQLKGVEKATISSNVPGSGNMNGTEVYAKDIADKGPRNEIQIGLVNIDDNYITTLGMRLLKGRNFYPNDAPSDSSSVIVNQAAVASLGWSQNSDPVGKTIIRSGGKHFTVVGLVNDFHYTSVKQKIGPLMMLPHHSNGAIMIKINTANVTPLIAGLKKQWEFYNTGIPFSYFFLDEKYAKLYTSEEHIGAVFTTFSVIAVIIACLGLFGLAAFTTRQRVREIGIRKVLGASPATITTMLSREFVKLIILASLISFPLTWYAMNKWLQDFAYRITIHWWLFVAAGGIALTVAILTISYLAIKAALANPVKSLRSE